MTISGGSIIRSLVIVLYDGGSDIRRLVVVLYSGGSSIRIFANLLLLLGIMLFITRSQLPQPEYRVCYTRV